jgi:hypothetical protein
MTTALSSTIPVGVTPQHRVYSAASAINTLAGIVADLGTNPTVAEIFGTIALGGIVVVPATVTLDLTQGGIDCGGHDGTVHVTILGAVIAPRRQIFFNCGYVTLDATTIALALPLSFSGNQRLSEFYGEWFGMVGDPVLDNRLPMQTALDSIGSSGGGTLFTPPGTVRLNSASVLGSGIGQTATIMCLIRYSNLTIDGGNRTNLTIIANAVPNTTLFNFDGNVAAPIMPAITDTILPAARGASQVTLTTSAHAANYPADSWVLVRTGSANATLPVGNEIVIGEIIEVLSNDPGTGTVTFKTPLVHRYDVLWYLTNDPLYPGQTPLGIVSLSGRLTQNFCLRNLTITKRQNGTIFAGRFTENTLIENLTADLVPRASPNSWGLGSTGSRNYTMRHCKIKMVGNAGNTTRGFALWPDTTNTDVRIEHNVFELCGNIYFHIQENVANFIFTHNLVKYTMAFGGLTEPNPILFSQAGRDNGVNWLIAHNVFHLDAASKLSFQFVANSFSNGVPPLDDYSDGPPNCVFRDNTIFYYNAPTSGFLPLRTWYALLNQAGKPSWINNVVAPANLPALLEDAGAYDYVVTPVMETPLPAASALPIRGEWATGQTIWRWPPTVGQPRGWLNTRAGRAAPVWTSTSEKLASWRPTTAYVVNQVVFVDGANTLADYAKLKVTTAGTTAATPPAPLPAPGSGGIVTNGSVVFTDSGAFTSADRLRMKSLFVVPTVDNGHVYVAQKGGITGASQPSWPLGMGATVTDGTVVWQEAGAAAWFVPLTNL